MRHWVLFGVMLLGIGTPAGAQQAPSALFTADARFRQPLTLAVRDRPLQLLLEDLRATRKLPLRADVSTRDERVTLFCRERPASEILAAVAQHFDYTWQRVPRGNTEEYLLVQTPAARDRERLQRETAQATATSALRRRMTERLQRARLSPEARRQLEIGDLQRRRELLKDPNERQLLAERLEALAQGVYRHAAPDAGADGLDAALAAMHPSDWERLWQGKPFRFAFPLAAGRVGLSETQAGAIVRRHTELQSAGQQPDGVLRLGAFEGVERLRGEVTLAFEDGKPELRLQCAYVARQPGLRVQAGFEHSERAPASPDAAPAAPVQDADLRREVALPSAPEGADVSYLSLSDVLEALAPVVPYTLIGDSYDHLGNRGRLPRGAQRLDEWLQRAGRGLGFRVRRQGGQLLFRHHDWARLRALQVPDRLVRRWEAVLTIDQAPPLHTLIDMARAMNEEQVEVLLHRWEGRRRLPLAVTGLVRADLEDHLEVLRLLGTLTAAEWTAARRSGSPLVAVQRPDQQAIHLRLLQAEHRDSPRTDEAEELEALGKAPPRPLSASLDAEERIESGAAQPRLRLEAKPVTFYVGPRVVSLTDSLDEALRREHQEDPTTSAGRLRRVEGTAYAVALYPDAGAEEPLLFSFLTSDRRR